MSNLLLAIGDEDRPYATLNYASAVAASLGATLHILQMLPPLVDGVTAERPRMASARARRDVDRCIAACRQTRTWYHKVLGTSLPTQRLRIRVGELTHDVARHAAELDVSLVVLAASTQQLGLKTSALARTCSKPVLVARGAAPSGPIIAATNPHDDSHAIVQYCKELGVLLGTSVVAFHPASASPGLGTSFSRGPELATTETPGAQADGPRSPVTGAVPERANAVLAEAARHRARLIVVGIGLARTSASQRNEDLAAELVDRASCSVLVTPRPPEGSGRREGAALALATRSHRA
jgi:hypothetical protein